MRFFDNSIVNRLYLHNSLQSFAEYSGSAFVFVYLLKAGMAVPLCFGIMALSQFSRLIMRQIVVPLVLNVGLRNGLIIGTIGEAITFMILTQVHGLGLPLVAYVLSLSLGSSIYWTCSHAYFAKFGDHEKRGAQVSVMEVVKALSSVLAPLLAGLLFVRFNSFAAFGSASTFQAFSVLPLLSLPNVQIERHVRIPPRLRNLALAFAFSDGILGAAHQFIWLIALFVSLGENFARFGTALALAGLVGAGMALATGRLFDLGHIKHIAMLGFAAVCISTLSKAFGFGLPWSAVAASAVGAVVGPIHAAAIMPRVYNLAKASPCSLRYFVLGEGGWDLGTGFGCSIAALLTLYGFSMFWPLLFGLVGCVLCYTLLHQTSAVEFETS